MQKVTSFLEQNVQWVAIALGAAFALWMTYNYIILSPAHVQVGNETYTAANISSHTPEAAAAELRRAIENNTPIPMNVPKPAERFKLVMAWQQAPEMTLTGIWQPLPAEV